VPDEPGNGSVWTCLAQAVRTLRNASSFEDAMRQVCDLAGDVDTIAEIDAFRTANIPVVGRVCTAEPDALSTAIRSGFRACQDGVQSALAPSNDGRRRKGYSMFMFSRLLTVSGPPDETMAWAAEITGVVNAASDVDVTCWVALYGHPLGTVGWSARVENRAQIVAMGATLASDKSYTKLVNRAADWVRTPGRDVLRRPLNAAATPPSGLPPIGAVAQVTTAVASAARIMDAMAWGLDVAEYTAGVSGSPVTFLADVYGQFGGVAWIGVQPDMAAADAADERLNGDAGYMERIGKLGDLFEPGSGNVSLMTRIA